MSWPCGDGLACLVAEQVKCVDSLLLGIRLYKRKSILTPFFNP